MSGTAAGTIARKTNRDLATSASGEEIAGRCGRGLPLLSDDLLEMLADSEIAKLLAKDAATATVSGDLVEAASRAGSRDNIFYFCASVDTGKKQ